MWMSKLALRGTQTKAISPSASLVERLILVGEYTKPAITLFPERRPAINNHQIICLSVQIVSWPTLKYWVNRSRVAQIGSK